MPSSTTNRDRKVSEEVRTGGTTEQEGQQQQQQQQQQDGHESGRRSEEDPEDTGTTQSSSANLAARSSNDDEQETPDSASTDAADASVLEETQCNERNKVEAAAAVAGEEVASLACAKSNGGEPSSPEEEAQRERQATAAAALVAGPQYKDQVQDVLTLRSSKPKCSPPRGKNEQLRDGDAGNVSVRFKDQVQDVAGPRQPPDGQQQLLPIPQPQSQQTPMALDVVPLEESQDLTIVEVSPSLVYVPGEEEEVDSDALRRRRRNQLFIVAAVVSVLLISLIATAVVGTRDRSSPADVPTTLGTDQSSDGGPPTSTGRESLLFDVNDSCERATFVNASMETVIGSTYDAENDDEIFVSCPSLSSPSGPYSSAWYEVMGTGVHLQAAACSNQSDIEVSLLSGTCDNIACVQDITDQGEKASSPCGFRSSVSWLSLPGRRYFVVIHGLDKGSFELSVSPRHDACGSALPFDLGHTVTGTTVGAHGTSVESCSGKISDQVGVWYVVKGTGLVLEATNCIFSPSLDTDFVSTMEIFSGSCNNLTCVNTSSDLFESEGACRGLSLIQWASLADEMYYVFMHSSVRNATGFFGLRVRELNDQCEQANGPLRVNDLEPGSTALAETSQVSCRGRLISRRGLWYSVLGTGEALLATACTRDSGLNADFDSEIFVLRGRCGNFICLEGNNDGFYDCDSEASAIFPTLQGGLYHIFLAGAEANATGSFGLEIRPFVNDQCELATELTVDSIQEGSTVSARPSNGTKCTASPKMESSVWYRFAGNGEVLMLEVCAVGSSAPFSPQVSILHGACEDRECVPDLRLARSKSCLSVHWIGHEHQNYYIVVHEFGDFVLDLRPDYGDGYRPTARCCSRGSSKDTGLERRVVGTILGLLAIIL